MALEPLIAARLADRRADGGIYVRGSGEHFGWLRSRAAAASLGGKAKAAKACQNVAKPAKACRDLPTAAETYPLTLPPPLTQNKNSSAVSPSGTSGGPIWLAETWNRLRAPGQPEVRVALLTSGSPRWRSAQARLVEVPDADHWTEVIRRIAASPFCRGENDRGWKADFEFMLRRETHIKALEGKYDDATKRAGESSRAAIDDEQRIKELM